MNSPLNPLPPSAARPGALELHCQRFPAMLSWYRQVLGAELLYRDAVQAWLRAPAGWSLLLLDTQLPARPRESSGLAGLSLEFEQFDDLVAQLRALKTCNIYPERAVRNGLLTSLVYRDPDRNPFCLRHLLPASQRAPGPYRPMGEEFDIESLLEPAPAVA